MRMCILVTGLLTLAASCAAQDLPILSVAADPPSRSFVAQERSDFRFTWTLNAPLAEGSEIRIITPREGGWMKPSLNPESEEFDFQWSEVKHFLNGPPDRGTRLAVSCEKWSDRGPPYTQQDRISQFRMVLEGGGLEAGDSGEVLFVNARVSRLALHQDPTRNVTGYRMQVRPGGQDEWTEIAGLPIYQILPGEAHHLDIRGPSQVVAGEPFRVTALVADKWNNPVPDFAGTAQWWCTDEAAELPKPLEFTKAGKGLTETSECVLNTPGRHFLRAILDTDLSAWNVRGFDVEVIEEAPELRLFWGELHNHGMLSYDARNWGGCTMRPHDAYWYAQHFTNLDFAAVTDHSMHNGRLRQQNMTEEQYQECQRAAADCYDAGKFVTFTAVEQRCARGDTNTYFLNDDETYYMRDDIMTVQQMWEYYRDVPIITIPHLHPMSKRKERFDEIDPEKERLIEIHSNHGRYEYFENEPLKPKKGMVDGNSVQQILARGHRLGIVAASDDHSGRPGVTDITGIYAPELTRPAIFEAMRARHTYGTTGPKMNVLLTMGEHMMGDDVRVSEGDALLTARTFGARVLATEPLTKIEIIRSGETIYSVDPDGEMAEFEYTDMDPLADGYLGTEINNPPTVYYYLRITQQPENAEGEKGLQMAWTSPIFISPEG